MGTYPFCPVKISVLRVLNLTGSKICVFLFNIPLYG